MNELTVFNNEEFGEVRTVNKDGEVWLCLKDVCAALDIKNVSDCKTRLKADGIGNNEVIDRLGRKQLVNFINEPNLYRVILQSRKENAERFTDWVTSEVIPSIRKNGGYIANQEQLTPEQIVANALVVAQNILAQKEKQIEELSPKAAYFDDLVDRKLNLSLRDTAKEIGLKEKDFIAYLIEKGYLFRDQKKALKPYAEYAESGKGYFTIKEATSKFSMWAGIQTLVTPKGREVFRLLTESMVKDA